MAGNEAILRGVTDKDQKKELRKMLKKEGWSASITGSNHVRLEHRCGATLQVPLTAGGSHAAKQMRRRARRVLQQAHRQ